MAENVTINGHVLPVDGNIDIGYSEDIEKVINASKIYAARISSAGALTLDAVVIDNVGVAATDVTAVEAGDDYSHTTTLTLDLSMGAAFTTGTSLAAGKLIYTLPAGACIIESAYMSVGLTDLYLLGGGDNTPDLGIGTVIGSGAVAVLGGTATFENIITGQTAANCTGTATVKTSIPTAAVPLVIEAGAAHTIHLNVADAWVGNEGDLAITAAGTVVINWKFVK